MHIRIWALNIIILVVASSAHCSSISGITTRSGLNGNAAVSWSNFGPDDTDLVSGSSISASDGLTITVSQPFYGLQIRQQSKDFYGDFAPGEALLTNWNSSFAVTISFSQGIYGAGVQVEPGQVQDTPAPFTAFVTAYSGDNALGTFSTTGIKNRAADGSTPFLGVLSDSAEITSLTYHIAVQTNGPFTGDLGMNYLSIRSAEKISEPATAFLVLLGFGIAVLTLDLSRQAG